MPAREGPLLVTLLRNLFADCTKDGDDKVRALAAPIYARMRKGDAPWLRPRGGGLKICPPEGGRICIEGEGFGEALNELACLGKDPDAVCKTECEIEVVSGEE